MRIALLFFLFALDLNTATVRDLQALPGIGPALAKRIVDFREKRGGFRRVEELLAVPGISEKKWQVIKAYLYVKPRNVNGTDSLVMGSFEFRLKTRRRGPEQFSEAAYFKQTHLPTVSVPVCHLRGRK